ncbi:hypothetical protein GCM10011509_02840 [Ornithinimicrobium pekingense]|uniref:Uncharacterized protein n=1 Tax=Ornithinimicrobium pekingense TaxID=384677 RepID=A0ABQ2F699_9MICO|nr:hypothetical protein GCM10011509_02840 [Ornithinimicrobium pekingense]
MQSTTITIEVSVPDSVTSLTERTGVMYSLLSWPAALRATARGLVARSVVATL